VKIQLVQGMLDLIEETKRSRKMAGLVERLLAEETQ
jgi:hypothetical protein